MFSFLQSCGKKKINNLNKTSNKEINTTLIELDIDKTIEEAYKVWYVKKGNSPNFSNYKDYYTTTAIFQDFKKDTVIVSQLSEEVKEFKEAFKAGNIFSFDEREVDSETTIFGEVANRVSYHIYHTNSNDSITKRGVNSIQLVKIKGKWKIQSILRQVESESYQLPKKYNKQ